MIGKNQIKLVRSLESKKGRSKEGLFVAEGPKVVADLMAVIKPRVIFATAEWIEVYGKERADSVFEVSNDELRGISFLKHPQNVMALFPMRGSCVVVPNNVELYLALDDVQDPGNLGTIIRIADWFGISRIYCSRNTADVYNPKVVQATMGSIARVEVVYVELTEFLSSLPENFPIYGTFLDGEDIYKKSLTSNGIIVMGNEGKGISPSVARYINNRLLIPSFPKGRATADSLNVAIATAITCAEFRR